MSTLLVAVLIGKIQVVHAIFLDQVLDLDLVKNKTRVVCHIFILIISILKF